MSKLQEVACLRKQLSPPAVRVLVRENTNQMPTAVYLQLFCRKSTCSVLPFLCKILLPFYFCVLQYHCISVHMVWSRLFFLSVKCHYECTRVLTRQLYLIIHTLLLCTLSSAVCVYSPCVCVIYECCVNKIRMLHTVVQHSTIKHAVCSSVYVLCVLVLCCAVLAIW